MRNRKCCDPKFDFQKKLRTGSITGVIARREKARKKRCRSAKANNWHPIAKAKGAA